MKFRLLGLLLIASQSIQAEETCGKVTIVDEDWPSASVTASIDSFILKYGFGCETELISGDTTTLLTSMIEKGEPDIFPEMWTNAFMDLIERGTTDNKLHYAGKSLSDGGVEGFWVPKYMVDEYPELATIDGVIKHAELFTNPEDPDLSAFYNCPSSWNCSKSSANLVKALELDKAGFEVIDPGSSAGLSGSLAKANNRKEPWLGYYWEPTAILGQYDMVQVDFGTGVDEEEFNSCTIKAECESPKPTMFPKSLVLTITTESYLARVPETTDYLKQRAFTNDQMNALLAWMEDNQADGEVAMEYFLTEHPEIWRKWLKPEVADRVANAL